MPVSTTPMGNQQTLTKALIKTHQWMQRGTSLEKIEVKSDTKKTGVVSEMKVLESVSNLWRFLHVW